MAGQLYSPKYYSVVPFNSHSSKAAILQPRRFLCVLSMGTLHWLSIWPNLLAALC